MSGDVAALLARWHSGDRDALDGLVRGHLRWVRDLVHRRLGDALRREAETQDLVQEAMIDVLTYGPRLDVRDAEGFRAVLARIVENNIRDQHDHWQRSRRARRHEATTPQSALGASMTTPSQAADRTEHTAWLRVALDMLAKEDRELIRMREWERLSFQDIGDQLGVQANTARMRFARAVRRLAETVGRLRKSGPPA